MQLSLRNPQRGHDNSFGKEFAIAVLSEKQLGLRRNAATLFGLRIEELVLVMFTGTPSVANYMDLIGLVWYSMHHNRK